MSESGIVDITPTMLLADDGMAAMMLGDHYDGAPWAN